MLASPLINGNHQPPFSNWWFLQSQDLNSYPKFLLQKSSLGVFHAHSRGGANPGKRENHTQILLANRGLLFLAMEEKAFCWLLTPVITRSLSAVIIFQTPFSQLLAFPGCQGVFVKQAISQRWFGDLKQPEVASRQSVHLSAIQNA